MLRAASLMRCAITRRMPITGISSTPELVEAPGAGAAGPGALGVAPALSAFFRLPGVERAPEPGPAPVARLPPASGPRRRGAGEGRTGAPAAAVAVAGFGAASP